MAPELNAAIVALITAFLGVISWAIVSFGKPVMQAVVDWLIVKLGKEQYDWAISVCKVIVAGIAQNPLFEEYTNEDKQLEAAEQLSRFLQEQGIEWDPDKIVDTVEACWKIVKDGFIE